MTKELFLKILKSETEDEIDKIITNSDMGDSSDWVPYGNQQSNWSIIGNQSSSAERALVEKITNSVDALLMRKCLELGIDPKGKAVPTSPKEALVQFYNIKDGKCSNLTKDQETEICKDLCLIATSQEMKITSQLGRNSHVNLMVYDGGEGQSPNKLADTILSLLRGNKQGIPFTQGNYNQGGSGALMYCGEKGYCLVVSRRHPNIDSKFKDSNDESLDLWGWTLIRLEMRPDTNDPMFTYYAPNGIIPRFHANKLPLKPKMIKGKEAQDYLDYNGSCSAGLPYQEEVDSGTAIKMYKYNLKQKGPLVSHFKYELSRCILDTYLPVNVIDCRKNKFNNQTLFRGLNKLIEDDINEKNEDKRLINERFPIVNTFSIDNQEIKVTTYGLNHRKKGQKNEDSFLGDTSPIRFTLGQQFQGDVNKTVISNAGLGVLKDSLLLIVEFPKIDPVFKKDLFMTDRERLLDKKPKKEVIKYIKTFLSQDETLQEFASEKMKKIMTDETTNDPNVKSALEKWLENSPEIQNALGFGTWFPSKSLGGLGENEGRKKPTVSVSVPLDPIPVITKEIPSYFIPILRKKVDGQYFTTVTKGKKFSVRFKTDAREDFFERLTKKGIATVLIDGKITNQYSINIKNGKASFYFTDKIAAKLGEINIEFNINCQDEDIHFTHNILLEIHQEKAVPIDQNGNESLTYTGLPPFNEVTQTEWPNEMNESTGATIQSLNNKVIYLINIDNIYLKNKLESLKSDGEKEFYKRLYTYAMLFSAMAAKNHEDERRKNKDPESFTDTVEDVIAKTTESVARTFFVMEQLSKNLRDSLSATV